MYWLSYDVEKLELYQEKLLIIMLAQSFPHKSEEEAPWDSTCPLLKGCMDGEALIAFIWSSKVPNRWYNTDLGFAAFFILPPVKVEESNFINYHCSLFSLEWTLLPRGWEQSIQTWRTCLSAVSIVFTFYAFVTFVLYLTLPTWKF